jgi:hypothetical protein
LNQYNFADLDSILAPVFIDDLATPTGLRHNSIAGSQFGAIVGGHVAAAVIDHNWAFTVQGGGLCRCAHQDDKSRDANGQLKP